jgi:hypothetical protein
MRASNEFTNPSVTSAAEAKKDRSVVVFVTTQAEMGGDGRLGDATSSRWARASRSSTPTPNPGLPVTGWTNGSTATGGRGDGTWGRDGCARSLTRPLSACAPSATRDESGALQRAHLAETPTETLT